MRRSQLASHVSRVWNRLRRAWASFTATPAEAWDHKRAQEYEFDASARWMIENAPALSATIADAKRRGERWAGSRAIEEFFPEDSSAWPRFAEHISTRTCLEIGPGPCGAMSTWWWAGKKIVIDPLADRYRELASQLCSETWWTPDITYYSECAEHLIPELEGAIDGTIVCRNALDHCAAPMLVVENIARYAAPNCVLLLWTDLWHFDGGDTGHRNISRDAAGFAADLRARGFEIEHEFSGMRPDGSTIDFGCRATKL